MQDFQGFEQDVVLVYMYVERLSLAIEEVSASLYVIMWPREDLRSTEIQRKVYGHTFSGYLNALNFSQVLLISNTEDRNVQLAQYELETYPSLYSSLSIIPHKAVGRSIKPQRVNLISLFVDKLSAYNAFEAKKMNKVGYAYILSQEASFYRYFPKDQTGLLASGILFVADTAVQANSSIEFEIIAEQLNLLSQTQESNPAMDLKAPTRRASISLFSLNNSTVSLASKNMTEFPINLTFPGNSTTIPQISKPKIRARVNPDGTIFPGGAQITRGIQVAFQEANMRQDLVPNYDMHSVAYTGVVYSYELTYPRIVEGRENLGIIALINLCTSCIIGVYQIFTSINVTVPISGGTLSTVLSSPETYPYFIRPRVANDYLLTIIERLMQYFRWSHVAVLYSKDRGDMQNCYDEFARLTTLFNIEIANSPESRVLVVLNNETAGIVNASLSEILASDARINLLLHTSLFTIIDQMYDLGVRGSYLLLFVAELTDTYYSEPSDYKRRIGSKGWLMFFPRTFAGQSVLKKLVAIVGAGVFSNTCFYYDEAYLYFYALDYLIQSGMYYDDPDLLVQTMRETFFTGCGGFFRVEPGTKTKELSAIVIRNIQYDSEHDTYTFKEVGSYNPYTTQPYQLTEDIHWLDDSHSFTDLKPKYQNCRFLKGFVRNTTVATLMEHVLSCFAFGFTLIVTIFIWKQRCNIRYPPVSKHVISTEDVLLLLTIVVDYLQFC